MRRGLTFIEVLIAVAVFVTISAALYSLLFSGISLRKRLDDEVLVEQNILLKLDLLAKDLRNSVSFRKNTFDFTADEKKISFFSLSQDYNKEIVGVKKIEYEISGDKLVKTVFHPISNDKEKEIVFLEKVKVFLAYYDKNNLQWVKQWQEKDTMPQAVKIELDYILDSKIKFQKYIVFYD